MSGSAAGGGHSRPRPPAREAHWSAAFLAELRRLGTVRAAAVAAGVGRSTVYDRMASDPEFRAAVELARLRLWDVLLGAVWERAIEGVIVSDEPIMFQGGLADDGTPIVVHVGQRTRREYSDPLLELLARIYAPERYGDPFQRGRRVDPTCPTGADVVRLARELARELGGDAGAWVRRAAALTQDDSAARLPPGGDVP